MGWWLMKTLMAIIFPLKEIIDSIRQKKKIVLSEFLPIEVSLRESKKRRESKSHY